MSDSSLKSRILKKLKFFLYTLSGACVFIAGCGIYFGNQNLETIRPASAYEDKGVRTFYPYEIASVQVRNRSVGRLYRNSGYHTEYQVRYKTREGTRYRWREEGEPTKEQAQQIYDRGPVERRVLSIVAEKKYITVEPDQNAESYTDSLKSRNLWIMRISAAYIVIYIATWFFIWRNKRKKKVVEPYVG